MKFSIRDFFIKCDQIRRIVLFNRKADRTNFYRQKNKLFKVRANHIVKPNNDDPNSDIEVSFPGLERENSYIYMNKTSMNRM